MGQRRFAPFITALSALVTAAAAFPAAAAGAGSGSLSAGQRATLLGYARNTWASFVEMTDAEGRRSGR